MYHFRQKARGSGGASAWAPAAARNIRTDQPGGVLDAPDTERSGEITARILTVHTVRGKPQERRSRVTPRGSAGPAWGEAQGLCPEL